LNPAVKGASSKWSPVFKSRLTFLLALLFSSSASLFRYIPDASLPAKMLVAGVFFGLSLACFANVLLHLRTREEPRSGHEMSGHEMMILLPLVGLVVAMLVTRALLLFRGYY
jgi:hypothetical protein